LTIIASLLLLGAAGCGGGDGSTGGEDAAPPGPGPEPQQQPGAPADTARPPPVGDGRGGVRLERIGSFSSPLYVTQPPGETDDLYVVEQGGRVVRVAGRGRTSTFLDLTDQIAVGGEQGLLSLAFAPDYQRSGRLYVDYTDMAGDSRIVEFRSRDGRAVDPSSRRELLRIEQPFPNHNGGLLSFGPDRLLYIGTGDGGAAGDPERNGQDLSTLLGKILRIDPRRDGDRPYRIPPANPFAGTDGARGEVYSYGLRNPWRFAFDRRGGALAIGDVGQDSREEVDLVPRGDAAGANFGWSAFEGDERFNDDQQATDRVEPVLTYATGDGNCAVTGGYVVRDERLRSLYGRYLYGDFCAGELRSFPSRPGRAARDDVGLGLSVESLSSFGEDDAGRIYVTSLNGPVYRLEPGGSR
jgi:glucose/arabinose dehydrogenase